MSPEEIAATYEVLAPMATDYANANLERAGQAQASYGPLAQAAMGDSQTAGIGNYTYNRLVRPAVDTMRDQLIVEGYSAALNKQLSDALNKAKENYNRASRRYSRGGGGGGNNGGGDGLTIEDELIEGGSDTEDENGEKMVLNLSGSEAFAGTVNRFDRKLSKQELEELFNRPMPDAAYNTYSDLYAKRRVNIFQGSGK